MGERKVLNKYFPPDFDPSLIPRGKRPKNKQIEVRMMLPFSLQCNSCGEYMYRGKKFNSRKEDVLEENYHGIRIFRFYIKCIACASEITFKTDPKRGDYVAEHGCSRNFEAWRENEAEEEEAFKKKQEEEKGDSMKTLENRTLDSKREMDILDALDEIKAINQRHARIDTEALLEIHAAKNQEKQISKEEEQKQLEEDELEAKKAFQELKKKRILENDTTKEVKEKKKQATQLMKKNLQETSHHTIVVTKKKTINNKMKKKQIIITTSTTNKNNNSNNSSNSLVADYSDSSTSD
jgi:hypothetical protein